MLPSKDHNAIYLELLDRRLKAAAETMAGLEYDLRLIHFEIHALQGAEFHQLKVETCVTDIINLRHQISTLQTEYNKAVKSEKV